MTRTFPRRPCLALFFALLGCSDPAPASTAHLPALEPLVEPVVAPSQPANEPPLVEGALPIPRILMHQLTRGSVDAQARVRGSEVTAAECASGCALLSPTGRLTLALLQFGGLEARYPASVEVVRVENGAQTLRAYPIAFEAGAIARFEETVEGTPPWASTVTRGLGNIALHRWAEDIITRRATQSFSNDEVAPLVALGGAMQGRIVWGEVGETAYRIHLARTDASSPRLLATLPLQATSCDGAYTDTACVAPLSIDAVYPSSDGRFLTLVVHLAVAGDFHTGNAIVMTVPLDDASALSADITPETQRADLLRSFSAPGPTSYIWNHQDLMQTRGEQCDHACALFFENNDLWFVRPSRIAHGAPTAPTLFRPDGASAEVLISPGDDAETRAQIIERGLTGAPRVQGRRIVARQANASSEGVIHVPLVELRAPHVGAQLSMVAEGEAYVIRMRRGDAEVELGRVPALHRDGHVSPPTLVEVFAPPVLGSPLVVLGAAPTRLPSDARGLEHTYFHATLRLP